MFRINNLPAADNRQSTGPDGSPPTGKSGATGNTMASDEQFIEHLRRYNHLMKDAPNGKPADQGGSGRGQSKLWELTDLSPSDFADEVARFAGLERVTLEDLLSAPPLNEAFSQRFLREMTVFPYQTSDGTAALAVADPTDRAAQRAAEIVKEPPGDAVGAADDDASGPDESTQGRRQGRQHLRLHGENHVVMDAEFRRRSGTRPAAPKVPGSFDGEAAGTQHRQRGIARKHGHGPSGAIEGIGNPRTDGARPHDDDR